MKRKFKILFIHQDGIITGSFISLTYILKALDRESFDPEVLFLKDGSAVKEMADLGVRIHVCPTNTFWTYPGPRTISLGNLQNYKALIPSLRLRKKIKSISPDIIHINDRAALNAGISMCFSGIPIIQHLRSTYYIINSKINATIQKFIIGSYAKTLIGITEAEAKEYECYGAKSIYNSIDFDEAIIAKQKRNETRASLGMDNASMHIGWVGKYNTQKGLWDFLAIAKNIIDHYPEKNIVFHMIGKLPTTEQLEKEKSTGKFYLVHERLNMILSNHKYKEKIILYGYRSDYLNVMAAFDMLISCNRLGSMGRQPFEAMSVGTLSIATHRNPEITRMITNGVNGYVFKEGDIESIVQKIIEMYNDRVKLAEIANKGLMHAMEEFDNKKQTKKIEAEYLKILNK